MAMGNLKKQKEYWSLISVNYLVLQQVAEEWEVEAMPTFIFLKEGTVVDKVVGAKKGELQQTIAKHMATASAYWC